MAKRTPKPRKPKAGEPPRGDADARAAFGELCRKARAGDEAARDDAERAMGLLPRGPKRALGSGDPGLRTAPQIVDDVFRETQPPLLVAKGDDWLLTYLDDVYCRWDLPQLEPRWEVKFKHSPAMDDTEVRVVLGDDVVLGDVRKKVLQRYDLATGELLQVAKLDEALGQCAVWGDRVVALDKKRKEILALDLGPELGTELWRHPVKGKPDDLVATARYAIVEDHVRELETGDAVYEARLTSATHDRDEYLEGRHAIALGDTTTGQERWSLPSEDDRRVSSTILGPEHVVVVHAVKTVDKTENSVSVTVNYELSGFRRETGALVFTRPFVPRLEPSRGQGPELSCAFAGDLIYTFTPGVGVTSWLSALDPQTGEVLWELELELPYTRSTLLIPHAGALEICQSCFAQGTLEGEILSPAMLRRLRLEASE